MTTPRTTSTSKRTTQPISNARPMPTRFEDMTPADLDAIYLRIAQAVKRFEARQAARALAPTADNTPTGGQG